MKRHLTPRDVWRELPQVWRVARHFLDYTTPYRAKVALAGGLGILLATVEILRPWPLQLVFDHVLLSRPDAPRPLGIDLRAMSAVEAVLWAAGALLTLSAVSGLVGFAQTMLLSSVGQRVVTRIRRDLFRHLLHQPLLFHRGRKSGDLLMRLTGDIVLLRELLVGTLAEATTLSITLLGTLAVMFWLDARLTLITLAITPVMAALGALFAGRMRRAVRRSREQEGALSAHSAEALHSVPVLQSFRAVGRMQAWFERRNRSSLRAGLRAARLEATLRGALDLLSAIGVGVTLALGVLSVRSGNLTPGSLLVFLAYQRNLYKPLRQLSRLASRAAKSSACGERVLEILETEPEIADAPDAVPAPRFRGELHFDGVSVQYPGGDLALDGVDLHIPSGSVVAIHGPSGAGKSTLVSLPSRLLEPTRGTMRIDGQDVRRWSLDTLREQIAIVFQDSTLLGFSIRENISLGRPEASDAEVEEAARCASILEFASQLPNGLDTIVGERGGRLSGGQKQRVALARAALTGAPILILDEPFAHLDAGNRDAAAEALRNIVPGRTVLLVTHETGSELRPDLEVYLAGGRLRSFRPLIALGETAS